MKYQQLTIIVLLLFFGIMLSACDAVSEGVSERESEALPTVSNVQLISPSVNVTLDENRYVITLWQGGEYFTDVEQMTIRAHDPNQAGHPVTWEGDATNYTDYEIPYWVVYPEFTGTGLWQLDAIMRTSDGQTVEGSLLANVKAPAESILVGMEAPHSDTLTLDSGKPIYKLTTDITPNEVFYEQTIADAVTSGEPSLVVFATPGLCSNFICEPVMDSSIQPLWEMYQDELNFVHVEIYDLDTSEYVPAMNEWGLNYEPWTYVVDADGMVIARFDGPLAPSEISPIINDMLAS